MSHNKSLTDKDGTIRRLTKADFAEMVTIDGLPPELRATLRSRGRPLAEATKERITIRLSPDVLARFRATGPGWQTRVNAALADWLSRHSPADMTL